MEDLLLQEAKRGNEFAFAQIVERHEKRVYNLCLRMTGNAEDAADQTQETFLKAWRALPGFQGECALSTWLHRLATNCCIDLLRREKRRREQIVPLPGGEEEPWPDPPAQDPTPQEALERKDLQEQVRRAMERLTPEHRQILLLRERGGLSYEEIAQALRLETGTVKSRIARARLQLRKELQNRELFS